MLQAYDFQANLIGEVSVRVTNQGGDIDGDGALTVADIDAVCAIVRSGGSLDLNGDGLTDVADVRTQVQDLMHTKIGDVNLDGVFNSSDLVLVFQRGEYEDAIVGNSSWADGDWNCDGEFSSSDFVFAFEAGGYGDVE